MDIIEAISGYMDLRQKVEWGVNTCISLRPYINKYWLDRNEEDIATGQAWLNGKTSYKEHPIKEYIGGGGVVVDGVVVDGVVVDGVGVVGVGDVGGVGGVGGGVVGVVVGVVGEKQLIRSTINFGLNLILKDKSVEDKLRLLNSFAGLKGFTNLDYLEQVEVLHEKTTL